MPSGLDQDLSKIERRESHLWIVAFVILLLLLATSLASFWLLSVEAPQGTPGRATALRAVWGLLFLTLLFCAYVLHARRAFSKIRRLFEAQAIRDSLTGLLNRQSFPERVAREMARADRDRVLLGLLLCDLDNFKKINDTYGHPAGDDSLRRVAEAVLSATRGSDLVFRWGGDELVVLLSVAPREGILTAARRIRSEVRQAAAELEYPIDVSIGIAIYPDHGRSLEKLLGLADRALYIAKSSREKIHVGEEELPLDEGAFDLVFQPVVDSHDRRVLGYEVFSRDPEGAVSVADLFRRYAAVGQLDDLKRSIFTKQLLAAEELGIERIFINIDLSLLAGIDPPIAKPEGLDVVLEISESEAAASNDSYLGTIDAWRTAGYKFAIDDFGSGFISLQFISRLLPSFIKMDRSAIVQASQSERFGSFLRDIVAAMSNYSREGIIAEGVETEAELEMVKRLGMDQVQGHLTGRPQALARSAEARRAPLTK